MPLFHGFTPNEGGTLQPKLVKVPEEVGYWFDHTEGQQRYIVARPKHCDFGAEVHSIPYDSDHIISVRGTEMIVGFGRDTLEEEILPGLDYRTEMVNQNGELGKLVLQHLFVDGTNLSLN